VARISETGKTYTAEATSDLLVEMFLDMTSRPPKRIAAIIGEDVEISSWIPGLSTAAVHIVSPNVLVRIGWKFARTKRILSPDGSIRQIAIRKAFNRGRKALRR
jgi:hypothetical protein